ncbi:hypothetical protein FSP39_018069 [Pinctada imbricata]|uniref:Uncharacterized protein n=1 Tax=Pinctada imbricata TaxID=66713 RepID=A0AA89C3R8_PINIB|nr:hypothetical protein FSP39_018069 [Pinctada imbricata]
MKRTLRLVQRKNSANQIARVVLGILDKVGVSFLLLISFGNIYGLYAVDMLQSLFNYVAATVIFLYGLLPLIAKTNPWILQKIVFLNEVAWPPSSAVKNPQKCGLKGAKNFYLDVTEDTNIGVWYVPPQELQDKQVDDIDLKQGYPIILYLHGNTSNRAASHRVELYKVLANMNYHVLIIDYRGYADSKGVPSEEGVVQDSLHMYKWIKERSGDTPIFLWGHSLGTGIGSRLAKHLCETGEAPNGLVLEAPFTNVKDAAANHPFSYLFRKLPWFHWTLIDPLDEAGVYFKSDKNIAFITCDILILHAEDDVSVPYKLGKNLYETALQSRPESSGKVEFVTYKAHRKYGHKYICRDPDLPNIISPLQESFLRTTKYMTATLIFLYVIIPIILITNPWIHSKLIFLNFVRWPPFIDVTNPLDLGIKGARSFYLDVAEDSRIGVWQILPSHLTTNETNEFERLLKNGEPIFLYLHGTTGTRAGWHRVQLLKLLASMGYHVIAIDYRGYADSKGTPSEDGVVADGYHMYRWIRERSGDVPVILWGHSLGTAITSKLAKQLCDNGEHPEGVILESPFNNIRDAAVRHPFTALFRYHPYFKEVFIDTIAENHIYFSSDENIASVTTPLFIVHAEDDEIVPYELGVKLYESARSNRPPGSGPLEFLPLHKGHGYGHKHIFQAPELPDSIRKFVAVSTKFKSSQPSRAKDTVKTDESPHDDQSP